MATPRRLQSHRERTIVTEGVLQSYKTCSHHRCRGIERKWCDLQWRQATKYRAELALATAPRNNKT